MRFTSRIFNANDRLQAAFFSFWPEKPISFPSDVSIKGSIGIAGLWAAYKKSRQATMSLAIGCSPMNSFALEATPARKYFSRLQNYKPDALALLWHFFMGMLPEAVFAAETSDGAFWRECLGDGAPNGGQGGVRRAV
ncbi:MAG: hypothetical protein HZC25_12320, partial [Rhodospirillales bacterium]|nr:hypothetical protein [Rhodospirillales bacterium]